VNTSPVTTAPPTLFEVQSSLETIAILQEETRVFLTQIAGYIDGEGVDNKSGSGRGPQPAGMLNALRYMTSVNLDKAHDVRNLVSRIAKTLGVKLDSGMS
jgi:hypothetical protein